MQMTWRVFFFQKAAERSKQILQNGCLHGKKERAETHKVIIRLAKLWLATR